MANIISEIGSHPADWSIQRVDSLFNIQQGKSVSKAHREGNNQKPFLRTKNVFWGKIDFSELDHMHFTEQEETRLTLQAGDLLLCEGGDVGRTAIWNNQMEGCYHQNHLHRLRAKAANEIDPHFALYWFWYAFEIANLYIGRSNVTTIPNLSQSKLSELQIPKPEINEQRRIAHVLTAVQTAIEQQSRLIELTRELKFALMGKLFTEGLRGEKQKKTDLGFVPKSWNTTTIGAVAKLQSGGTPSRDNPKYWKNGTIPWVKTGEINYKVVETTEEFITKEGLNNSAAKILPKGTLLAAMYGQGITRGRVGILGLDATANQACAAITPFDEKQIATWFLYYYMQFHYQDLRDLGHGANQRNLNMDLIKSFPLSYPEIEEQQNIIETLSAFDKKVSVAIQKQEKLEELFRTLLHQLMTGQVRVKDLEI
jgi:type I restriction enzyme S subunit